LCVRFINFKKQWMIFVLEAKNSNTPYLLMQSFYISLD